MPIIFKLLARALVLGVLFFAACSSVPEYTPPKVEVPKMFKGGEAYQSGAAQYFREANPQSLEISDNWWELFNDPILNDLQQLAAKNNNNLAIAATNVRIAMAASGEAGSFQWPPIGVSASANQSRVGNASSTTTYSLQAGFSNWELDIWNKLGAAKQIASAKEEASLATLAAVSLSVQGSVTQTYFSLRNAESLENNLEQAVLGFSKTLEITNNLYEAGMSTMGDVSKAQSQLAGTQAQVEQAKLNRAQLENALASLVGIPASSFRLEKTGILPAVPQIPLQVPSRLLERRPDIASAERSVASANASIGLANSAFYPSLTLSANTGFRNSFLEDLISAPSFFWSIGPTLTYSLFDDSARETAKATAMANYDQTVASYRQTVLTALQEVEDNLAAVATMIKIEALQKTALDAAWKSLEVTLNRYKVGISSYQDVVTDQSAVLNAQNNLQSTRANLLIAQAVLLKNLAGRWENKNKAANSDKPADN